MALIQCSQCQHHISKKAATCPQCGHPNEQHELPKKERKVSVMLFLGILFIPYLFSWFTLRKGYRLMTQIIAFSWLTFMMYSLEKVTESPIPKTAKAVQVKPQKQGISYEQAEREVGCDSKYTDDLQRDLFNSKYKDKWFTWTGVVQMANSDHASLNLDNFGTSDVTVYFADPKAGYTLVEGETITVKFKMFTEGGCFLPFSGKEAKII